MEHDTSFADINLLVTPHCEQEWKDALQLGLHIYSMSILCNVANSGE